MVQASTPTGQLGADERIQQRILDALKGLRFGSVEVVIHDGKVVQIERREKVRIETLSR